MEIFRFDIPSNPWMVKILEQKNKNVLKNIFLNLLQMFSTSFEKLNAFCF
jgi:hypothetical protein